MPQKTPLDDFLAWRMDVEGNQRAIAESKRATLYTLRKVLSDCAAFLPTVDPVECGDRLETCYRLRWSDGGDGVSIYGPGKPMSQAEIKDHFRRRIEAEIAKRAAA